MIKQSRSLLNIIISALCLTCLEPSSYAFNNKNIIVSLEAGAGTMTLTDIHADTIPGSNINPVSAKSVDNTSPSLQGGAALGYEFSTIPFTLALQYLYSAQSRLVNGNYSNGVIADPFETRSRSHALLINLDWNCYQSSHWTLFAGGGIGVAYNINNTQYTQINSGTNTISLNKEVDDTNFAAAIDAGVTYHFSDVLALSLLYRFTYFGLANLGNYSTTYSPNINDLNFKAADLYNQAGLLRLTVYFYRTQII